MVPDPRYTIAANAILAVLRKDIYTTDLQPKLPGLAGECGKAAVDAIDGATRATATSTQHTTFDSTGIP